MASAAWVARWRGAVGAVDGGVPEDGIVSDEASEHNIKAPICTRRAVEAASGRDQHRRHWHDRSERQVPPAGVHIRAAVAGSAA